MVHHGGATSGYVANLAHFPEEDLTIALMANTSTVNARDLTLEIADLFQAKIINVTESALIIEFTGNPNKTQAFLNLVSSYEITEMSRTGNVALARADNF